MSRSLSFFVMLIVVVGLSRPAAAADAANGEVLARRWCAACHIVAADQQRGSVDVPNFATIGRRPDFDVGRLALFLMVPHPQMPSMTLSRAEAADLAAYIQSQGK